MRLSGLQAVPLDYVIAHLHKVRAFMCRNYRAYDLWALNSVLELGQLADLHSENDSETPVIVHSNTAAGCPTFGMNQGEML